MIVADQGRIVLRRDITRDLIHRAGRYNEMPAMKSSRFSGCSFLHKTRHPGAFKLEHRIGPSFTDHMIDICVVEGDQVNLKRDPVVVADHINRITQDRQRPQSEEIKFQQTNQFNVGLRELDDDRVIITRQGSQILSGWPAITTPAA